MSSLTHQAYRWKEREFIEPIKCMLSSTHPATCGRGARGGFFFSKNFRDNHVYAAHTHPSYRWRGRDSHRAIEFVCAHHTQAKVERRESHRANQVYATHYTPSYRWRGGESHRGQSSVMHSPHHQLTGGEERRS